ncbi:unnamed protein product [Ceutorhynchus assimilis]|uniref:Uncharacterized protein n=1 Tax=Ceutorhynchus assimilis TaxID=467358 RepID=A0A9N9MLL5_9CUCU|nr:unnamed protein product [Ceutorhynchus assimilis]
MADSRALLTLFLEKRLHDRRAIIDETFKLIYDYNKDRKKVNYEKTLKTICSLLGKEIPNKVLIYLLTLLDMPLDIAESDDNKFIEKMKSLEKIHHSCLEETIKPELEDCILSGPSTSACDNNVFEKKPEKHIFLKPRIGRRKRNHPEPVKPQMETLLDLAALFITENHQYLKDVCQEKFDKAWKLIRSNQCSEESLKQCYKTLEDLNKKRKLLREIENDTISDRTILDFYWDEDIILREQHVYDFVNFDFDKL